MLLLKPIMKKIYNGKEKIITKEKEEENENKEFFEEKLNNDNQTLESDENPNNKKVRRNKNYNQKIVDNKEVIIQEKEFNIQNKEKKEKNEKREKKKKMNKDKRNLNQILLERELNEIKKKLEKKQKQKQNQEQEQEKIKKREVKKIRNNYNYNNNQEINFIQGSEISSKISPRRILQKNETIDKFNTPSNNDICSQLLQATMDNEKKLYLVPYAKKKEKVKKTFNTIGKSNGIPYSDYSVIKGIEINNNVLNMIREDDRRSLSKRREFSENGSMRRSNYTNANKFVDDNSESKF